MSVFVVVIIIFILDTVPNNREVTMWNILFSYVTV